MMRDSLSIFILRACKLLCSRRYCLARFIDGECLLFIFGQRRVADSGHGATNASNFKNLSADDLANPLPVFLLTNQCVNVWDRDDSFLLHFKQCRCNGISGETVKLLTEIPMIVALDVFDNPKCDRKFCPDSPVKNVPLTGFVLLVQQDVEEILLLIPFPVIFRIDTPFTVEISIAEKRNQRAVFAPAITNIFFPTWFV